jgi:phosphate uptake regulator
MDLNAIKEALIEELSKLPIPGDSIVDISNQVIKYQSGSEFPAPIDNRLKKTDTVKEISYELFDDELYISINHSHGILDKVTSKTLQTKELLKITRRKKLDKLFSE